VDEPFEPFHSDMPIANKKLLAEVLVAEEKRLQVRRGAKQIRRKKQKQLCTRDRASVGSGDGYEGPDPVVDVRKFGIVARRQSGRGVCRGLRPLGFEVKKDRGYSPTRCPVTERWDSDLPGPIGLLFK